MEKTSICLGSSVDILGYCSEEFAHPCGIINCIAIKSNLGKCLSSMFYETSRIAPQNLFLISTQMITAHFFVTSQNDVPSLAGYRLHVTLCWVPNIHRMMRVLALRTIAACLKYNYFTLTHDGWCKVLRIV